MTKAIMGNTYNKSTKSLIESVTYKMINLGNSTKIEETCPISIIELKQWEWPQGVGLYGMLKYYEATKDNQILDYLVEWFDANIEKGLPEKNVNTMCPMLTLSYLYEYTGNEAYLKLCTEWVEWVVKEMPRTVENGLQHIVTGNTNEQQLWDDTLFMTVLFVARMGVLLSKESYVDEAVKQFLLHVKYLADVKSGLFHHGWTFEGRHNFAEAKWARGNCWYTVAVPELIDIVNGVNGGVKDYLISTLEEQIKTLGEYQNENGMWHTLIDDPSSYVETSATAGFAFGILKAVRLGYIDNKYKVIGEKALEAVIDRIKEDGEVTEVSYGTGMGATLDDYRIIPLCPMLYGQALALLALMEALEL